LGELLDRVAERQRLDFGHMASDLKADGSLITACDRWSDEVLVEGLAQLFPEEGVLSEEGAKRVPSSEAYWVVDPLDGTTNFAAGIPYWAISLARFEHGKPVLAVLDVPPLRQRIVAVRGQGAWRNGKPLQPPALHTHPAGCASL
jgi:myo-inositol-1(or 4)-monophosphatase